MDSKMTPSGVVLAQLAAEALELLDAHFASLDNADVDVFNRWTALRDTYKPLLETIIRRGR